jgi:hypothetical protein
LVPTCHEMDSICQFKKSFAGTGIFPKYPWCPLLIFIRMPFEYMDNPINRIFTKYFLWMHCTSQIGFIFFHFIGTFIIPSRSINVFMLRPLLRGTLRPFLLLLRVLSLCPRRKALLQHSHHNLSVLNEALHLQQYRSPLAYLGVRDMRILSQIFLQPKSLQYFFVSHRSSFL